MEALPYVRRARTSLRRAIRTVAPQVALYAARERDRRALMLYGILVGAGILMDLTYLVGGAAVSWLAVGFAIVQLGLKLAVHLGLGIGFTRLRHRVHLGVGLGIGLGLEAIVQLGLKLAVRP